MNLFCWLGLLFVGAKLFGAIDWSWWLVTTPFWAWGLFLVAVAVIAAVKGSRW